MNPDVYEDRPAPSLPWWLWLWMVGFTVFAATAPIFWLDSVYRGTIFWLAVLLPAAALVWWYYFSVRYHVDGTTLRARAAWTRVSIPLDTIENTELSEHSGEFFSRRNRQSRRILNRLAPTLRITHGGGQVLIISPMHPDVLQDEINRSLETSRKILERIQSRTPDSAGITELSPPPTPADASDPSPRDVA
jgi:DUF3093 family protein